MSTNILPTDGYNHLSNAMYRALNDELAAHGAFLIGKVLTLVDSSFADPEQRKAFKDVLKEIWDNHYYCAMHTLSMEARRNLLRIIDTETWEQEASEISPIQVKSNQPYIFIDEKDLGFNYSRQKK